MCLIANNCKTLHTLVIFRHASMIDIQNKMGFFKPKRYKMRLQQPIAKTYGCKAVFKNVFKHFGDASPTGIWCP